MAFGMLCCRHLHRPVAAALPPMEDHVAGDLAFILVSNSGWRGFSITKVTLNGPPSFHLFLSHSTFQESLVASDTKMPSRLIQTGDCFGLLLPGPQELLHWPHCPCTAPSHPHQAQRRCQLSEDRRRVALS